MRPEIYSEGVGEIGFNAGMVRLNMMGLSATDKDENGNPKPESREQVIMSLRGFLISLQAMQNMADKLVEAGVLQRKQDGAAAAPQGTPPGVMPS